MPRSLSLRIFALACSVATAGCMAREVPAQAPVIPPSGPPTFVSYLRLVGHSRAAATQAAATAALRASAWYRTRPDLAFFRLGGGYAAVGRIELTPCRDEGLDPGYVHMHVTFGVDGAVSRAVVESPTRPSPEALDCIGRRLEEIAVPAFEGGDVTLSKSLYLVGTLSGEGGGSPEGEGSHGAFPRLTVAP